eukprot:1867909-Pyramimonas_sp.AAC.1
MERTAAQHRHIAPDGDPREHGGGGLRETGISIQAGAATESSTRRDGSSGALASVYTSSETDLHAQSSWSWLPSGFT